MIVSTPADVSIWVEFDAARLPICDIVSDPARQCLWWRRADGAVEGVDLSGSDRAAELIEHAASEEGALLMLYEPAAAGEHGAPGVAIDAVALQARPACETGHTLAPRAS